jgi:aspartyl-tRNA synthetase
MRTPIGDIAKKEGQKVELAGWVHTLRSHGKINFIDLRDRSGLVQVVLTSDVMGGEPLSTESVVEITGTVKRRPENLINANQSNGALEIQADKMEILNYAEGGTPVPVDTDGYGINEDVRMKYRYVDLRRERMQGNIALRHKLIKFIRDFLDKKGFYEIETPILTKSTPEGARDYLVPSRIENGKFYALPQSPQQYKQLLMAAGMEKYFQIARCFRDEDTRGDRQPEFTQLDLEMSFVGEKDVMKLNEKLLIELVKKIAPEKRIQQIPFPKMSYAEAMEKYGTDRPDLRENKEDKNLLAFCWVVDFPFFEKTEDGGWTFTHNPFSAPKPKFMKNLLAQKNLDKILTTQYDVVLNGWEIGGGSIRNHKADALMAVFKILGYSDERIERDFKHMLQAFKMGTPPHGGIAWGIDRLVMILQNEPNIREVIAFPKSGDGHDFMMNAPSEVEEKQLKELGIEIKKDNQ